MTNTENTEYLKGYDPRRDGGFWGWFSKLFLVGFIIAIAFCVWLVFLADAKAKRDGEKLHQQQLSQWEAEQEGFKAQQRFYEAQTQTQTQKVAPKAKKTTNRHP